MGAPTAAVGLPTAPQRAGSADHNGDRRIRFTWIPHARGCYRMAVDDECNVTQVRHNGEPLDLGFDQEPDRAYRPRQQGGDTVIPLADVPDTDLNVTIAGGSAPSASAIVLYDSVPGGAGLVAQIAREIVFDDMLRNARDRVQGNCGCDASCYGCLRSYRNQFAHPHLNRQRAQEVLQAHGHSP